MSDDRVDGGQRSVIGADLRRTVGGRGDRFDKGSGATKRLEQDRKGERGPVDPRNPRGLAKPPQMSVAEFLEVKRLTDAELSEKLLAYKVYRANGLSSVRAAKQLGVPLGTLRAWQAEGRERKLTFPAIDEARAYVEDHLTDLAVDGLAYHLKRKNLDASLKTLSGVGVLRSNDAPVDGRLPTQLNVQIVDAQGVVISVGDRKAPVLEGVMGRPKAHAGDLPAAPDDLG